MIKSRLEARSLRIWLFCAVVFLSGALISSRFFGFYNEARFYRLLPFLNFDLTLSGTAFGKELPSWLTDNFSFACSLAVLIAIIALAAHIIYVVVLNVYRLQRHKAAKVLRKTGYSKEYFELLEKKKRKLSKTSLGAKNDLCIAKAYCDGRRYEDAFSVLRDIDLDSFDSKMAAEYYNLYTYLFLLTGDINSAKSTVSLGEPFCSKYPDRSEQKLTAALLKYAEKDYYGAKEGFEELLDCKPIEVRVWAGLYLGLVYLRLHKKERARKLVGVLGKYKKTPRQSEDMLKLLKKLETAYALEAEEQKNAAAKEQLPELPAAEAPEAESAEEQPAEAGD